MTPLRRLNLSEQERVALTALILLNGDSRSLLDGLSSDDGTSAGGGDYGAGDAGLYLVKDKLQNALFQHVRERCDQSLNRAAPRFANILLLLTSVAKVASVYYENVQMVKMFVRQSMDPLLAEIFDSEHMSITSSNTDSDLYSSWREMPPNCAHKEGDFIVGRVQIRRHRMMSNEMHTVLNTGLAFAFVDITHHAVRLFYSCNKCPPTTFYRTADFSSKGKHIRFGRYRKSIGIVMDAPFYMPSPMLCEIFDEMHGRGYCVAVRNCQHWAVEFVQKVEKMRLINTDWCQCNPEIAIQTVIKIERRKLVDKTFAVSVFIHCPCRQNSPLHKSFRFSKCCTVSTRGIFANTAEPNRRPVNEQHINISSNLQLKKVLEVYHSMPDYKYKHSDWNSAKWSKLLYDKVLALVV